MEGKRPKAGKPGRGGAKRRWLRRVTLALAALATVPLLLVPVYKVARPVSTLMVYRWITGGEAERRWVPLERIDPDLIRAVIASEDGRYCGHRGIDWGAVAEAINEDREEPRGASTIAMQTAKNLFLWPGRDYLRKGLEVPLAIYADLVLGKRRLLEVYLNVAEWGPGIFGIEEASRRAFGRPAERLTPAQAALLATALPNPLFRDPARPSAIHVRLAQRIDARPAPDLACLEPLGRNLARHKNLAGDTGALRLASVYSRDSIR